MVRVSVQTPLEERNILCKAAMLMGFIGFQFEVKVTKGGSRTLG